MSSLDDALVDTWRSSDVVDDLHALCDCGGRLAGGDGEREARDLIVDRLSAIAPPVLQDKWEFTGWRPGETAVELVGHEHFRVDSTSLVMSPPTPDGGLELEVLDLGRGTPSDFEAAEGLVRGKAVLVQHEFPFSTGHVHRREKYLLARRMGASAFIIANNQPDIGPVTGGTGDGSQADIPSVGISREAGRYLSRVVASEQATVRLRVEATHSSWQPHNLSIEIPGSSNEWIVLCAHYDGHDLAESAMDNGSGAAVALEVARRLRPLAGDFTFGLRVMFFTVEEWGLQGSKHYVENLAEEERARIAMVINLDTVVGHGSLNALTSGLADVEEFVRRCSASSPVPISVVRPMLANSDHINFVRAGIPAFRLIAGYEEPTESDTRYLLTPGDTRDRIDPGQLRTAALTVAHLVWTACTSTERPARYRPDRQSNPEERTGW